MPIHHVIIGGGPVATNAAETIRQFDKGNAVITLVCDEPAHSRMALPYWLSGQIPRAQTMTADDEYYKKLNVAPRIGVRATSLDPKANTLTLSDGNVLNYDNLLIATGSQPVGLPIEGSDLPGVQPLWTLAHTQSALDAVADKQRPRVVMIGSGFIGFIMLNAMHKRGWKLSVVEREKHVLPRMLNAEGATIVENWLASKDVDLHCGTTVNKIKSDNAANIVELADGSSLEADLVVIATGVQPNVALTASTGIEAGEGVDGGILVNDRMQTNFPNVYAGGDVAKGPTLHGNKPQIHAIQPTAVDHGRIAGANMAGHEVHYPGSLSMNILDICGLQCASFGNWSDASGGATTITNPDSYVYRILLWSGDQISGAMFIGQANDMGMLTDVGMVKGIMQTRTGLGHWKNYLVKNPFDIRRPFVATNVAQKLAGTTLLGQPARTRQFQFDGAAEPAAAVGPAHAVYVGTKKDI